MAIKIEKDLIAKCVQASEAEIEALLEKQKNQMVADLCTYDVSISTINLQAAEIEADQKIDSRTKNMLLKGLREYWYIKKDRMKTETKGSNRK